MIVSLLVGIQATKQPPKRVETVYDIEVAPNDQWMAITDSSDNIWIYTLEGKLLKTLHHKTGSHLVDVEISPDGKLLACANVSFDGDYSPVWSSTTWQEVAKLGVWTTKTFCDPAASIEFAANGKYIIGPTVYSREMCCWNVDTGAVQYMAKKTRGGFAGFAIHYSSTLALLSEAGVVKLRWWEFENSPKAKEWGPEIKGVEPRSLRSMKFSHDGKKLFLVTQPQQAFCMFNVLKPSGGKSISTVQARMQGLQPRDSAWAGDDKYVWVSGAAGHVFCFDPASGTLVKRWVAHDGAVIRPIAASTKGYTLITGAGKTICVWNGEDGKLLRSFKLRADTSGQKK